MLDKYEFKILKYINSNRSNNKLNIQNVSSKFEYRNGVTRKDVIEILDSLKRQKYINYVGVNFNVVTTHKGRMYIKSNKFKKIKSFIKNYIYPIIITIIGCLITYYLSNH